ncbi:hypothetical protein GIV19_03140 [Pseudomonas syringae]|uniref:hypothetical protein n=1 Tax=Pseudomonas syringae TaxID=317 RepID=UPI001F1EA430|nr:hypothetical protein [Pseudomonas syringae]MCF5706281.1 hypothetical protein [Pseudomonas syringae]
MLLKHCHSESSRRLSGPLTIVLNFPIAERSFFRETFLKEALATQIPVRMISDGKDE